MGNVENTLKMFFKTQGLKQKDIAEMLGKDKTYINQLLNGKSKFGKAQAELWAKQFGFSEAFLLTGKGELFDEDEYLMKQVDREMADNIVAAVAPDSAGYWKARYEDAQAEIIKLQGQVEGLRMAMAAMHQPLPTLKTSVG